MIVENTDLDTEESPPQVMSKKDAAARMGLPESEVSDVVWSKAGTVIRTSDDVAYILVPEDTPDADGKSGLMFLVKPSPRYMGTFPVFAPTPR